MSVAPFHGFKQTFETGKSKLKIENERRELLFEITRGGAGQGNQTHDSIQSEETLS